MTDLGRSLQQRWLISDARYKCDVRLISDACYKCDVRLISDARYNCMRCQTDFGRLLQAYNSDERFQTPECDDWSQTPAKTAIARLTDFGRPPQMRWLISDARHKCDDWFRTPATNSVIAFVAGVRKRWLISDAHYIQCKQIEHSKLQLKKQFVTFIITTRRYLWLPYSLFKTAHAVLLYMVDFF